MSVAERIIAWARGRPPDKRIGPPDDVYMDRWFVIPRNPVFNVYVHRFLRDDDDRALHDHPWMSLSLCLAGTLGEVTQAFAGNFEAYHGRMIFAGQWRLRRARFAHRLELFTPEAWTLFITGPRIREWGFLCPQGWRHWREFTTPDGSQAGRGCE